MSSLILKICVDMQQQNCFNTKRIQVAAGWRDRQTGFCNVSAISTFLFYAGAEFSSEFHRKIIRVKLPPHKQLAIQYLSKCNAFW